MIRTSYTTTAWKYGLLPGVNLGELDRVPVKDNADPTGYAVNCYQTIGAAYSDANIQAMVDFGWGRVRLITDIAPICICLGLGLTARAQGYVNGFAPKIAKFLSFGLKVNFDCHQSITHTLGYTTKEILDTPAKFTLWMQAQTMILNMLKQFSVADVGFDLMNEPECTTVGLYESTLAKQMWDNARAADSQRTLIVCASNLGSYNYLVGDDGQGNTLPGIIPTQFDKNTLFTYHQYDPSGLTHQGYDVANLPNKYFDGIEYPFLNLTNAITLTTAKINADGALSAAQKTATITDATNRITNTFNNLNEVWLQRQNQRVVAWCVKNGIDLSRIYVSEFGVTKPLGANTSPSLSSRVNYSGQNYRFYKRNGMLCDFFVWENYGNSAGFSVDDPAYKAKIQAINNGN